MIYFTILTNIFTFGLSSSSPVLLAYIDRWLWSPQERFFLWYLLRFKVEPGFLFGWSVSLIFANNSLILILLQKSDFSCNKKWFYKSSEFPLKRLVVNVMRRVLYSVLGLVDELRWQWASRVNQLYLTVARAVDMTNLLQSAGVQSIYYRSWNHSLL